MGKHQKIRKIVKQDVQVDDKYKEEHIHPVIKSLTSTNEDTRLQATTALANLVLDSTSRSLLLREKMLHILLTNILSDNNLEIVASGLGVIRNTVLLEGRDSAVFLVRRHIELPLNLIASKCSKYWSTSPQDEDKEVFTLLTDNVCGLTSAIVIHEPKADIFTDVVKLGYQILTNFECQLYDSAIEMIYYISEDNTQVLNKISDGNSLKNLAAKAKSWSAKVYMLGIMFNKFLITEEDKEEQATEICTNLAEYLNEVPENEVNGIEVCLDLLAITSQTDVLEILVTLHSQVIPKLFQLINKPEFTIRCLSVLNNIGWAFNAIDREWKEDAKLVAEKVYTTEFKPEDLDAELYTSVLGLLSALAEQVPEVLDTPKFTESITPIMDMIEQLYKHKDESWVALGRALVVALGTNISLVAKLPLVSQLRELIMLILEQSKDVEAVIDSLDTLFDLFGDNKYEYNAQEYVAQNMNDKLDNLKPQLKRVLKSPPKELVEIRMRGQETLKNLDAFIIYKTHNE